MKFKRLVVICFVASWVFCLAETMTVTEAVAKKTTTKGKKVTEVINKDNIKLKSFDNILYNKGEEALSIYSDINQNTEIARVDKGQIVYLLKDQNKNLNYYKVSLFPTLLDGESCQYIEKNKDLITGKKLQKYILTHRKDFTLRYKKMGIHGVYLSKDSAENDNFEYASFAVGDESDCVGYKTKTKKSKVDGKKKVTYVKIKADDVLVRNKKGTAILLTEKGNTYHAVGKSDNSYKIKTKRGVGYIAKKYCKAYTKKTVIDNKVEDTGVSEQYLYPILETAKGLIRIIVDNKAYYMPEGAMDIEYMPTSKSCAVEVEKDCIYDVAAIEDDCLRIIKRNSTTKSRAELYIPYNKEENTFDVKFNEAELLNNIENNGDNNSSDDSNNNDEDNHHRSYHIPELPSDTPTTLKRDIIVAYGMQFLGNRYVYGGTDPYHGIDCSAFQQHILNHFGIACGRSTAEQVSESAGRTIPLEDIKRGDLIYYSRDGVHPYHVVMYIGDGKVLHASCAKYGICIGKVNLSRILKVKNYID